MASALARGTAGLLALGTLLAFSGGAARAGDIQAPWFQSVTPMRISATDPLGMASAYLSFWRYTEGVAWAQYGELRLAEWSLPAAYLTRAATPLPSLPSAPASVVAVAPKAAPAAVPAPARAAAKPAPEQPAPAPAKPAPSPAPNEPEPPAKPAPAPAPEQPVPAPAEPAPSPAPHEPEPPAEPAPAPSPAPAPTGLTADEQEMVSLVNAERTKAGLAPLSVDMRLVRTARAKSQDMVSANYFGHDSPTLGSPFDQIRAAGITYRTAGENIAGNKNVTAAHTALMNSSGHRANILRKEFTKVGIGIIRGGPYGLMVTQQFIGD